jgi:transposase
VVAATVVGITGDVTRFASRDRFAAFNGTAPIEVSSGNRRVYRLSRRGNRQLNHAIHMAAVTQIRHHHCERRVLYDQKIAEGKTPRKPSAPSVPWPSWRSRHAERPRAAVLPGHGAGGRRQRRR